MESLLAQARGIALMFLVALGVTLCLFVRPIWLGVVLGLAVVCPLALIASRRIRLAAPRVARAPKRALQVLQALAPWSPLLIAGTVGICAGFGVISGDELDRAARGRIGPAGRGGHAVVLLGRLKQFLSAAGLGVVGVGLVGVYAALTARTVSQLRRATTPAAGPETVSGPDAQVLRA